MQDIRKPYSHSRYNRDISSRVEAFERHEYEEEDVPEEEAVMIPARSFKNRRKIENMEMFPRRRRDEVVGDGMNDIHPRDRSSDILYNPDIDTDPHTPYRERRRRNGSPGTWMFLLTTGTIVAGVLLLTFVFNSATITYTPKYKDVEIGKAFMFSLSDASMVPYELATSSLTRSKTLPLSETKKVESKASGVIVVYNNFDAEPQRLIKNTRFESSNGKIYRINNSVTVPGKQGNTPGSVEVTVYADSFGADYNIPPSDFSIPGFKGTPRYEGFYARSKGPMKGGASGNMSLVSQPDLDAAKDELALEMTQELKETLSKVVREGSVPLYSAITVTFDDNEADVMAGVTSTYEVTATGYLMLAEEASLARTIAEESMSEYDGQDVKLDYENELAFTLKPEARVASDARVEVLVEGKPRVVYVTNEEILKELFAGKERADAPKIVEGLPSVNQIEMSFFPLWLSSIPTDKESIHVAEFLPKR